MPRTSAYQVRLQKADLSDENPLLASNRSRSVNLDTLRAHTGSGIGGKPLPATSVLESSVPEGDGALASSIRVPSGATGSGQVNPAKAPVASQIRAPSAPVSTQNLRLPVGLRQGQ